MNCPEITGLRFSPSGQEAIKEIRQKTNSAKALSAALGGSVLATIFLGNGALYSSWNISQFNWGVWSQAMGAIPNILKSTIQKIAYEEGLKPISAQEKKFWEAVAHGCN